MSDSSSDDEPSDLDVWKEVHKYLTDAIIVAREAVAAQSSQRRFWLEEIRANLTEDGKLTANSVWKRPVPVKKQAAKRGAAKPSSTAAKRRKKDSAGPSTAKPKKARKKKRSEEEDEEEDEGSKPKKKIRLVMKKQQEQESVAQAEEEDNDSEDHLSEYQVDTGGNHELMHPGPADYSADYSSQWGGGGGGLSLVANASYAAAPAGVTNPYPSYMPYYQGGAGIQTGVSHTMYPGAYGMQDGRDDDETSEDDDY